MIYFYSGLPQRKERERQVAALEAVLKQPVTLIALGFTDRPKIPQLGASDVVIFDAWHARHTTRGYIKKYVKVAGARWCEGSKLSPSRIPHVLPQLLGIDKR